MRFNKSAVVAGTGTGQLKGLHGEGEVVVIGVIDQEPVKQMDCLYIYVLLVDVYI